MKTISKNTYKCRAVVKKCGIFATTTINSGIANKWTSFAPQMAGTWAADDPTIASYLSLSKINFY